MHCLHVLSLAWWQNVLKGPLAHFITLFFPFPQCVLLRTCMHACVLMCVCPWPHVWCGVLYCVLLSPPQSVINWNSVLLWVDYEATAAHSSVSCVKYDYRYRDWVKTDCVLWMSRRYNIVQLNGCELCEIRLQIRDWVKIWSDCVLWMSRRYNIVQLNGWYALMRQKVNVDWLWVWDFIPCSVSYILLFVAYVPNMFLLLLLFSQVLLGGQTSFANCLSRPLILLTTMIPPTCISKI